VWFYFHYELRFITFLNHIWAGLITSYYFTFTFWEKKILFHSLAPNLKPVAEKQMSRCEHVALRGMGNGSFVGVLR